MDSRRLDTKIDSRCPSPHGWGIASDVGIASVSDRSAAKETKDEVLRRGGCSSTRLEDNTGLHRC